MKSIEERIEDIEIFLQSLAVSLSIAGVIGNICEICCIPLTADNQSENEIQRCKSCQWR